MQLSMPSSPIFHEPYHLPKRSNQIHRGKHENIT